MPTDSEYVTAEACLTSSQITTIVATLASALTQLHVAHDLSKEQVIAGLLWYTGKVLQKAGVLPDADGKWSPLEQGYHDTHPTLSTTDLSNVVDLASHRTH